MTLKMALVAPVASASDGLEYPQTKNQFRLPRGWLERPLVAHLEALVQVPQAFHADLATRILNGLFGQPSLVIIANAAAQSMQNFTANDWVATIAANTPAPLHDLLRSLLFAKLPVATEDDLVAYGKQIAAACQEKLLARDKAALIAALSNISIETHPEVHAQIQQQLVDIENRTQNKNGNFNPAGHSIEAEKKMIATSFSKSI
jgi:hypothetical protein